jgi:hypothetical protein
MEGKVPSRIAFTWPVNSLTETGLGGAELNACAFNQWVAWNVLMIAERAANVFA